MKGYHTSWDRSDITGINRNEVVFEGRHKAYGAFYIRTRYPNTLLLAMFSSVVFVMVCAITSYSVQHYFQKETPAIQKTDTIVVNPVIPFNPVVPKPTQPPPTPPKSPASTNFPPVVVNKPLQPDTTKKPDPDPIAISTTGTGHPNVDPNPGTTGGGGSSVGNPDPLPPDNSIHPIVSEMPKFPNGSVEDYLRKNTQYPPEESEVRVGGTVYVTFVVEKDGSVSNVQIARGVAGGPGLEREAKRVVSSMPPWIPGKQNGIPARVQFVVPISFKIQ